MIFEPINLSKMKTYYHTSEGQLVFDRTFALIPFFWKLLVKAFIYCPLWLTGYIICRQLLPADAKGYYWVGCIILVAACLYSFLFVLKGMTIAFRCRRNPAWILLFAVVVAYTCIPPGIVAFDLLRGKIPYPWLTWALSVGAGLFAYSKYRFLEDIVPQSVWGFYMTGLRIGRHPSVSGRKR
jgi:hypothetical protein